MGDPLIMQLLHAFRYLLQESAGQCFFDRLIALVYVPPERRRQVLAHEVHLSIFFEIVDGVGAKLALLAVLQHDELFEHEVLIDCISYIN